MFTVADFLKVSDVKDIILVAGVGGIEKEIFRTNIMDNPDTFDWLAPGEFLLSTGFIFRDDEALQRNIIRKLSEIGCSGLGLKIKRYLPDVPACMIDEAEKLDFPLISLPYSHSLSTISSVINTQIYAEQQSRLESALKIHRELTSETLRSGGLYGIIRIAVGFLNNPIMVFDSSWRLLCWEDCAKNPLPIREHFPIKRKEIILPQEFIDSMPTSLDMFCKPITRSLQIKKTQQVICRIVPVATGENTVYGYIVVWETVRTLDMTDHITLEQVAISVAIERLHTKEIEQTKARINRDFFDDLLAGNIESTPAAHLLAELHGLRADGKYRCIFIRHAIESVENSLMRRQQLESRSKLSAEVCGRVSAEFSIPLITVPRSTQLILLIRVKNGGDSDELIKKFTEKLYAELSSQFSSKLSPIVVGAAADSIWKISDTFEDVLESAKLLRETAAISNVIYVEDYLALLMMIRHVDRQQLSFFVRKTLGELIDYDKDHGSQLIKTLDTYFALSGNITEAAKCMYIHRNTYIYRLDKIKAILSDDFSNPIRALQYQLALLLIKNLGE